MPGRSVSEDCDCFRGYSDVGCCRSDVSVASSPRLASYDSVMCADEMEEGVG